MNPNRQTFKVIAMLQIVSLKIKILGTFSMNADNKGRSHL